MPPIRILMFSIATIVLAALPMVQEVAHAQGRRAPRRAAAPRAAGVVVGAYYRPLFLSPFYDPFYDPWWFPYHYGQYPPYGYGRGYDLTASLRLQVSPRETEVFVDGYYAGSVDDFDGMFQRMHIRPGEHDVTLYLDGHRTVTQKIFLQDHGTFRVRHTMEALGAGQTADPRPMAPPRAAPGPRPGLGRAPRPVSPQGEIVRGDPGFCAIAIRVQPADAEVYIDGERWEGPQVEEALVVQIAPGTHRVEVRKAGYREYMAEVAVTGR